MEHQWPVAVVCRVLGAPRSSIYARRQPKLPARPGPATSIGDHDLLQLIRRVLHTSPFAGEGYRKVRARLRREHGVGVSGKRVLRLLRWEGLLAPQRVRGRRRPRPHDGTIIPEGPKLRYQVRGAVLRPPPARPIPILVAAQGRRMLRLTARYADVWNTAWYGLPDELLCWRLAELQAALEAEGRDPATLRRTVGMEFRDPDASDPGEDLGEGFGGSVDELAWAIDAYEQLGFDDLIVQLEPKTMRSLDRLAEALELRTR